VAKSIKFSIGIATNGHPLHEKLPEAERIASCVEKISKQIKKSKNPQCETNKKRMMAINNILERIFPIPEFHRDAVRFLEKGNFSRFRNFLISSLN